MEGEALGASIQYTGLDVHKDSIDVATADEGPAGEVRHMGQVGGSSGQAARPLSREASLSVVPQFRVVMLRPPLPRMAPPALLSSNPPAQCK